MIDIMTLKGGTTIVADSRETPEQTGEQRTRKSDLSIIDLLTEDYRKQEDTVYRKTSLLRQKITPDDLMKKKQFDLLATEIGDPFFYGVIESNIGKVFHFLPVRFDREAWLLCDSQPEEARFRVRYNYHTIDLHIRAHGEWREIKSEEPVKGNRYYGVNKSYSAEDGSDQIVFFVFDIIRTKPMTRARPDSSHS